jgi:hypothetical protein
MPSTYNFLSDFTRRNKIQIQGCTKCHPIQWKKYTLFIYQGSIFPYTFVSHFISTVFDVVVLSTPFATHNAHVHYHNGTLLLDIDKAKFYPQTKAFSLKSCVECCTRTHWVACTFVVIKLMSLVHHCPQTSANLQPTVKGNWLVPC